jgi:3-dehydroquinate dehydratase-1
MRKIIVESDISRSIPRVAVIIDGLIPLGTIAGLKGKGADILEIRIDRFSCEFDLVVEYIEKIRKAVDVPMIGTIRETKENKVKRLTMFKRIEPFVDAIDIEIDADITKEVIGCFTDKTVIVSEHDFDKTPDENELSRIVDTAKSIGADIIKIAAMAHCREDVIRLLMFTKERSEQLVTISMGDIGRVTRVIAPLFGSLFTYAFITKGVAPGQLSLDHMVEELKKYYPADSN